MCFVRPRAGVGGALAPDDSTKLLDGASLRFGDVTDAGSLARDGFRGERFDALVSCLASRTGAPKDAWAVDHAAHVTALEAAKAADVSHMVLLSAICVQKPLLAFQRAKLAFEAALIELWRRLFDRPADRLLQIPVRADRSSQAGKALPDVWRWRIDCLQTDKRTTISAVISRSVWTTKAVETVFCQSEAPAKPSRRNSRASICSPC